MTQIVLNMPDVDHTRLIKDLAMGDVYKKNNTLYIVVDRPPYSSTRIESDNKFLTIVYDFAKKRLWHVHDSEKYDVLYKQAMLKVD